jgi:hypothetical protein
VKQAALSRPDYYDGVFPIVSVAAVLSQYKAPAVWLNVPVCLKHYLLALNYKREVVLSLDHLICANRRLMVSTASLILA